MARHKQSTVHGNQSDGTTKEGQETTNINQWRLLDVRGRQTWHYMRTDEDVKAWPQTAADRYHLGLPLVCSTPNRGIWLLTARINRYFAESARPSTPPNPIRHHPKCPLLLLPSPTSPRQLGVRIRRPLVPTSWAGHCLVRYQHSDTDTDCYRDETLSLCETEP